MADFDILKPGVWFGPRLPREEAGSIEKAAGDVEFLRAICEQMKLGNFSVRSALRDLILSSKYPLVRRQAIRIFCYTSRHEDVAFIGDSLGSFDHDDVVTTVIALPDTLSPEAIPYLFALLGEYEDTSIRLDILSSINRLFPWGYEGGDVDLLWLADRFSGFAEKLVKSSYYYAGRPAHPGDLCKSLIETVMSSKHRNSRFPLTNIPILLSVWSGTQCPVYYGDIIDDAKIQAAINFVSLLSASEWEDGRKYFYLCEI